ncbi:MAG: transglutaminase-like domain-containing protein [Planctomycetota bacterium]
MYRLDRVSTRGVIGMALLTLAFLISQRGHAEGVHVEENWYVVLLGDQRAGHVHQRVTHKPKQTTTETSMRVRVGRGDAVIEVKADGSFLETSEGEPVRAESSLGIGGLGGEPIVTVMEFADRTIHLTTRQGERTETVERPSPEADWLPPAAAARHVEAALERGDEQVTVSTIDPAMGPEPFTMTMTIRGTETVDMFGREVEAVVWDAVSSNLPGVAMREYVDGSGVALKSTVALMPGMEMTVVAADRSLALSELNPPEIMASTLVKPAPRSVTIHDARETAHATYEVRLPKGFDLPETAAQRVKQSLPLEDSNERTVVIQVNHNAHGALPDQQAAPPTADMTDASGMVDFESKAVGALRAEFEKQRETSTNSNELALAEALRRFVFDAIETKDLSVGFANATETAATRRGDCTEHAVLLAALLRSYDIPSRGVAGVAYVDSFLGQRGVFGFHMWTQAWLDPDGSDGPLSARWIDLDPALDRERPFDATHLSLVIDDLNAASPLNQMVALTPIMGRLQIRVLEAK